LRGTSGTAAIAAQWGASLDPLTLESAAALLAAGGEVDLLGDKIHLMGCATQFRGSGNGAALLWRERDRGSFTAEGRAVLITAAAQFGAGLAQLAKEEEAAALSRSDPLTGLLNRRGFADEVTRRLAWLTRAGQPGCLVYIDLDNFKLVNDGRGHHAGD